MRRFLCLLLLAVGMLGGTAQAFTFQDMAGHTLRLSDYKGRWVLVNFWATWCPPCLEEIPDLTAMVAARKDIAVIGVAMGWQDAQTVKDFADTQMMNYPVVLGNDTLAAQVGVVRVLPTSYLFDPSGKVVAARAGPITRQQIEAYIQKHPPR